MYDVMLIWGIRGIKETKISTLTSYGLKSIVANVQDAATFISHNQT